MSLQESIDQLLNEACPSIQFRIRAEILGEQPSSPKMIELQEQILKDKRVIKTMNLQQPDGWIGKELHGTDQLEGCIRLLREKGVVSNNSVISRALNAIVKSGEEFDGGSLFRVGKILDEYGLGGSKLIRAVVFAYAESKDHPFVIDQIPKAIEAFKSVLNIYDFNDITEPYRGKLVFKPAVKFPGIYHARLLAFTQRWRNSANMTTIGNAIQRLVELSPIPDIKFRYKGQIIAPASIYPNNLKSDITIFREKDWFAWFHTMELMARIGIMNSVPVLKQHVIMLKEKLQDNEWQFNEKVSNYAFFNWGAYLGLALENDWHTTRRRIFDLTFRSLLILHYSENSPAP